MHETKTLEFLEINKNDPFSKQNLHAQTNKLFKYFEIIFKK
jgi:hypothetical protein